MTTFETPKIYAEEPYTGLDVPVAIHSQNNDEPMAQLMISDTELYLDKENMIKMATTLLMIAEGHTTSNNEAEKLKHHKHSEIIPGTFRFMNDSKTYEDNKVILKIQDDDKLQVLPKTNETIHLTVPYMIDVRDNLNNSQTKIAEIKLTLNGDQGGFNTLLDHG